MSVPPWFLYISGFSLILLGAMQIQARPHERGDSFYRRFVNLGTLWSLVCIAVGVCVVLIGLGWWEGPLGRPPPAIKRPAAPAR
jgi:hypothetical protein